MGYYWHKMEQDFFTFLKKFLQCQQHGNLIHAPTIELFTQLTSWSFSVWGLDLIGMISTSSSQGNTYILTITDYITQWVEVVPLWSTKTQVIYDFTIQNIISQFGVSSNMILHNENSFENKEENKFMEKYCIYQWFSKALLSSI